jgi:DNA-binding transcriptional regulator YiaG
MINRRFESLDGEIWTPIFRDYEISNMGRVVSNKGRWPRILKTYKTWRGYHIIHPRISGKRIAYTIHRLVALVFIKNTNPERIEVNHKFGKDDNRAESLSWVTPIENNKHAVENSLFTRGQNHHKTTLDETQVKTIRSLAKEIKRKHIAKYFNISVGSVNSIVTRKSWAWL